MKGKFLLLILAIACVALGITLYVTNQKSQEEKDKDTQHIVQLSNTLNQTQGKLDEQKTVNVTLEGNINKLKADGQTVTNKLQSTESSLAATEATLKKVQEDAKAAAEASAEEIAKRDTKIKELEGQNDEMTKKMTDLNGAIDGLEKQIKTTEAKLATSEGDRAFLLKELKRLQTEKAELERQFNDLAVLREQVRKLKEELSISRRLDWIRRGLYAAANQKGAEFLAHGSPIKYDQQTNTTSTKVELHQNGDVKVQTNAPAATNTTTSQK